MSEGHSFTSAVVAELTRRKVWSTVGAYAVAVFAILQLMDAAVEPLRLPEWVPTLVVIMVILGFPLVVVLAWQFEITTHGIRRTITAGLITRVQSFALFSAMLLATGGLGFVFFQNYAGVFDAPAEQASMDREFAAPENSIAVLPFADLSGEGDQAHFSDGVAEEILNLLAQVDGLHVAARTSSFAFRDPQKDIREIGRLLNVSTVLEGSIRKAGNRIRLTAQLINVEDGYHIWSQSYDRELDDVFAIQDEVANSIATALVDSFAGLTQRPTGRTQNLAAFEAFRTGRLHWWRRTPQEIQRAIELFAKALLAAAARILWRYYQAEGCRARPANDRKSPGHRSRIRRGLRRAGACPLAYRADRFRRVFPAPGHQAEWRLHSRETLAGRSAG
jgi:TolB-like protein